MEQRLTVYLLDLQINAFSDNILTGLLVLKGVTKMGSGSSGLYLGTYGSSLSSGISSEDIKPFHIGVSLGAKAMNYDIKDKRTGKIYHFAEGSDISHIEVFAGKGTRNKLSPKVVLGCQKNMVLVRGDGSMQRGWVRFSFLTENELQQKFIGFNTRMLAGLNLKSRSGCDESYISW